jgi:hypothetical protein
MKTVADAKVVSLQQDHVASTMAIAELTAAARESAESAAEWEGKAVAAAAALEKRVAVAAAAAAEAEAAAEAGASTYSALIST